MKRYSRHLLLEEMGRSGQQKLQQARVLVVGAGGLGCPALQYLAAAGVGHIGIIDGDEVDESNLQRQILFSPHDVGKKKAEIAKRQLLHQNPLITVAAYPFLLDEKNATDLIAAYDLVLDGCDNFTTRYLVNDACVITGKPFVSGAVFKFEGQLSVFNYRNGPTYRCLYPEPGDIATCSEVGVLATLTGIIGTMMATEAIKIISEKGLVLSGKLLVADALSMNFNQFEFESNPANQKISTLGPSLSSNCSIPFEITKDQLNLLNDYLLVDVRSAEEFVLNNNGGINIPLATLLDKTDELPHDKPIICSCRSGIQSVVAVQFLKEVGFQNAFSLKKN